MMVSTVRYPDDMDRKYGKFEFITVAALRCRQLQKGARPRVTSRSKKFTTIAQEEVLAGTVLYDRDPAATLLLAEADALGEFGGEVGTGA